MSSNGPGTEPGPGPDDQPSLAAMLRTPKPNPETPAFVLYISCGNDASEGIVYQTDEHGRILGKVKLPYTATGIALHREHGLVLAIPRDGGKIMEIDETGKLSTILENDPALVHPVNVGVASNSDTVVAADNIANVLAFTNTAGVKAKIYRRLSGEKWAAQKMSVAVASDKSVIYGFEGRAGVFRCSGDDSTGRAPLLPNYGGVAADPTSTRWAAAQPPNQIYGYDGNELVKKLRLPPNKGHYQRRIALLRPGRLVVCGRAGQRQDRRRRLVVDVQHRQGRNPQPLQMDAGRNCRLCGRPADALEPELPESRPRRILTARPRTVAGGDRKAGRLPFGPRTEGCIMQGRVA